ncbi:LamG-like jellyroll fold domain-containing protein [Phycisphaerales bacterium AB-hyl4]|uniref:LamG-like jellyroll fold domain-containing protein n=1 Tax=Natronomicrosphaera hydrolytica TaxID=3242702 RepID=A0ABV4U8K4_9BACT
MNEPSIRWPIFLLTVAGLAQAGFASPLPEPVLEYRFDAERADEVRSSGQSDAPFKFLDADDQVVELLSDDGAGVTGLPGDCAFDNMAATGMGGVSNRPEEGGRGVVEQADALRDLLSFTLQGWFRTSADEPLNAYARLLKWRQTDRGFSLIASDEGALRMRVNEVTFDSAGLYREADEWVFFAVTYDGTRGDDPVRFYHGTRHRAVEAVDVAGQPLEGPIGVVTQPFTVGNSYAGDRPFRGLMDNIRVFGDRDGNSGALSAEQLETLRQKDTAAGALQGEPRFFKATTESIHIPDDELALFQAHLYGEMTVRFNALSPGEYKVELGNAELHSEEMVRAFDVRANGELVIEGLNLNEQFGFARPAVADFDVQVGDDGQLRIELLEISDHNHPRLSFLRVYDDAGRLVREFTALAEMPDSWVPLSHAGVTPRSLAEPEEAGPPWPGTYRIRPNEHDRLTDADVVGPDGLVYPDWRWAGLEDGIPDKPVTHRLSDFGGEPGGNVTASLQRAIDQLAGEGGGVLLLEAGEYTLDHPVFIGADNIVLRGAGPEQTRIRFRYHAPAGESRLFTSEPGLRYRPHDSDHKLPANALIKALVSQPGLVSLELFVDDQQMRVMGDYARRRGDSWVQLPVAAINSRFGAGEYEVRVVARYEDGQPTVEQTHHVRTSEDEPAGHVYMASYNAQPAAVVVLGQGMTGDQLELAEDAKRGQTQVTLKVEPTFEAGDYLQITAPATDRWNRKVHNTVPQRGGVYRQNQYRVVGVEGRTVYLNQPLRIAFPTVDGSYVQQIKPVRNVGVEDLSIEQTYEVFVNGVSFAYAWESWARNLEIHKAGRHPVHVIDSKHIEVRDAMFDGTWFTGGGAAAYVGFERSYDGLMENITTHDMRHAPNVQWAASGNVIRKSHFHGSDAQWHAGWTSENLYEQNIIESRTGTGGYGFGLFASATATQHGPQGPRNVVYNNDVSSPRTGVWFGGMNEAWMILHNRFVIEHGQAVSGKDGSFDHVIQGNVFAIRSPVGAPIWLATPDCVGWEVKDNAFYGLTEPLIGGSGQVDAEGNTVYADFTTPDRPQPEAPSIFEWQREHQPLDRDAFGKRD